MARIRRRAGWQIERDRGVKDILSIGGGETSNTGSLREGEEKMRDKFSRFIGNGGGIESEEEEEEEEGGLLRLGRCTGCQGGTDGVRDPNVDN